MLQRIGWISALLALVTVALLAGKEMGERWEQPEALPVETDVETRIGPPQGPTTVEVITEKRQGPELTTATGTRSEIPFLPYTVSEYVHRIPVKRIGGRPDRVLFSPIDIVSRAEIARRGRIRQAEAEAELSDTEPTIDPSDEIPLPAPPAVEEGRLRIDPAETSCLQGAQHTDAESGEVCVIALRWKPTSAEELEIGLETRYEPFTRRMEAGDTEGMDLTEVEGGWDPITLQIVVTGRKEIEPPKIRFESEPATIDLGDKTIDYRTEQLITLRTHNREARIKDIQIEPKNPGLRMEQTEQCTNETLKPGTDTRSDWCRMRIVWERPELADLEGTRIAVVWWEVLTEHQARTGQIADRSILEIPLEGSAYQAGQQKQTIADAELTTEPQAIDFETIGRDERAERTLRLTVEKGPATIRSIDAQPQERITIEDMGGCLREFTPGVRTGKDWCRLRLSGAGDGAPGLWTGTLEIIWEMPARQTGKAPDQYEMILAIEGIAEGDRIERREEEVPEGEVSIEPTTIDFGQKSVPGIYEHRALLRNASRSEIGSVQATIYASELRRRTGLSVDTSDCARIAARQTDNATPAMVEIPIRPSEECVIKVQWDANIGDRIESQIEIEFLKNGLRRKHPIEVRGMITGDARILREEREAQSKAAREAQTLEALRGERRRRAALPVMQVGVGLVHSPEATTTPWGGRPENIPIPELQWTDPSYARIGLDPEEGASTRPVNLQATVIQNTPIHASVTHSVDARYPAPVSAIVTRDVYAAHGRAVVIPRGTLVVGQTIPMTGWGGNRGGDGGQGAMSGLTSGVQWMGAGGRIDVEWQRMIREDGTAFATADALITSDIEGKRTGLPTIVDPYALEAYTATLMQRGLSAALLLARPDQTTERFIGESGQPGEWQERKITGTQLAIDELFKGLSDVGQQIAMYSIPQPLVEVVQGTKIIIRPTRDLWLRPATGEPLGAEPEDEIRRMEAARAWLKRANEREAFALEIGGPTPGNARPTSSRPLTPAEHQQLSHANGGSGTTQEQSQNANRDPGHQNRDPGRQAIRHWAHRAGDRSAVRDDQPSWRTRGTQISPIGGQREITAREQPFQPLQPPQPQRQQPRLPQPQPQPPEPERQQILPWEIPNDKPMGEGEGRVLLQPGRQPFGQ